MRSRLLAMLVFLPVLFGFSDLDHRTKKALKDPQLVQLEGTTGRFIVDLDGADTEGIQLCGLKVGETYEIIIAQSQYCQPSFKAPGLALTSGEVVSIVADADCITLYAYSESVKVCPEPVYLSVHCLSCPPKVTDTAEGGGPITTSIGFSNEALVQDVFIGGGCFEITNVTYSGSPVARGSFQGALSSIGISEGVILSSGAIAGAIGPNDETGAGSTTGGGGDGDLSQVANGTNINDAAVLEFDFTPTIPQISFRYVFASEEYCEYVNSGFNDAFGFFLSGPGINGPFSNNAINIATLPDGTNVSINNVNHLTNQAFYVPNIPEGEPNCVGHPLAVGPATAFCQFDGFTMVLTAVANVIPCETYHIKLAVGDGTDSVFDSAVFLEANSFEAGGTAEVIANVPLTASNLTYESCGNGFFTFTRNGGDISEPLVINFTVGGTATAGLDYQTLPTSVTIPPFAPSIQLPVTVFQDLIAEGQENIILTLDEPCVCDASTAELLIQEVPELTVDIDDQSTCFGLPITINPAVSGGVGPIFYQWSNGSAAPFYIGVPTQPGVVTLTVSDICGQTATATADIDVFTLEASMAGTATVCPGVPSDETLEVTFNGTGPWTLNYIIDGNGPFTINNITQNPYQLAVTEPGVYEIVAITDSEGCFGTGTNTITVDASEIDLSSVDVAVDCFSGNTGSIDLSVDVGAGPFTYAWSTGDNTQDIDNIGAGTYTVVVTDGNGCEEEYTTTLAQPTQLVPSVDFVQGVDCDNPTGGSINFSVSGGNPDYSYQWSNGDTLQNLTDIPAGTYTVLVTDANGCTVQDTALVMGDTDIPASDIVTIGQLTCLSDEMSLDGSASSSGPNIVYAWTATSGGAIISDTTQLSVDIDGGGTYELVVTDLSNNCFSVASVIVQENTNTPNGNAGPTMELSCLIDEVQLNGSASGGNVAYDWSTTDGGFVSATDIQDPTVNAAGTYQLITTNLNNGCSDTSSVVVAQDIAPPLADAGQDAEIDCAVTTTVLDASGSSGLGTLSYAWTTSDGNIVGNPNISNPEVDAPGTYEVTVTDSQNGCTSTATVVVTDAGNAPTVDIAAPAAITCVTNEVMLDGSGSSGVGNLTYNWTVVSGGNIQSGADTPFPTVGDAGIYQLEITDDANGCSSTLQVVVPEDQVSPVADPGMPFIISCLNPDVQLDGTGSSSGPNIAYEWTTVSGGNIVSGETSATPTISAPGIYQLLVTNTANGCASAALITIEGDSETPEASVLAPGALNCQDTLVTINGSGSSIGANFDYQWTTPDGNITGGVNTLFATINAAGTYTLSVLNTNNGCIASEEVTIGIDTLAPLAEAGTSDFLSCVVTSLELNGAGSSSGNNFSYQWNTQNGTISGDNTILNPTVTAPGTYVLAVFNSANYCVGLDSILVDENTVLPDAAAVVDGELNCSVSDLIVDGSGSSSGSSILYTWTTTDGNIVSGDATNAPLVDLPGTYQLTVVDTLNGCESTTSVTVSQDVQDPSADAGATATLTCALTDLSLDGSGSSLGADIQYNWTTQDGNIVSGNTSTNPLINQPGTYQLVVTDAGNTCTDTALVTIDQDIAVPTADAGLEATLTCLTPTLTLDGNGSSIGPNFSYNWSAANGGNILGSSTNLTPVIDAPGDYTIEVINQDNGCTATETVSIDEDTDAPDADAGLSSELNCAVNTITLDGSGSSTGPDFSYSWTTNDGNILNGASTLNPEIDAPGQYELLVVNSSNGCESFATVNITENLQLPVADPGPATTLTCVLEAYTIGQGASTTGSDITYSWTTADGNISGAGDVLETLVDAPGTYELVVFNTTNFCSDTAAVTIDQDIVPPAVEAGPSFVLDCLEDMVNLDATGTSTGANFTYAWMTDDGNLLSGQDGLSPAINTAGTYELVVTNTINGCEATDEVIVTEDADAPSADAGTAVDLTCLVTELDLNGTASSINGSFSVQWNPVSGGNILSGATTLNPTIDAPGTYQLTVVDLVNNCQAFATVTVNEDVTEPDAAASVDDELNCYNATVNVDGAGSSTGANYSYLWTTTNGVILGSPTSLNPEVGAAGSYLLEVTDQNNGCVQTAMVQVLQDTLHPVVNILSPDLLTCLETTIDLSGSASNTGPNFSISWMTSDGTINSGGGTLAPVVSDPGTYVLTIQDLDNGCESSAAVLVEEDVDFPTADAGGTNELDCAQTSLSLDGTGSDAGPNFAYNWTATAGGVLTGPTNILTPTVTAAGTYEIQVTNTANGCVSTDEVQITIDTLSPFVSVANPDQLTCIVEELNLNAAGSSSGPNYDYSWTASAGGNIVDVSNPISPLVNEVGSYTLTILDTDNSCTADFTVSVSANIVEPGADAGATTQLDCTENSISLQGAAVSGTNVSYSWTTVDGNILSGANTASPEIDAAGTYSLLVVDLNNGCESTDLVEITTNVPTDFGYVAQRPVCNTITGIIEFTGVTGGEPPYVYTINGGDDYFNTNFYAALPPGTYDIGIQDANGCELWDVAEIEEGVVINLEVETTAIIDLGDSYQIQTDLNLDPSEIQSITWTPTDGLSCTDCLNPLVTPTDNIEYEVRVETLEGCEATDRITLFVRKDLNVYIPTAFSPNGDNQNDVFMIFANDQIAKVNSFLVFNRWGETVFQYYQFEPNDPAYGWDGTHRGQLLNPAVFAWFAEIEYLDGRTEIFKGDVTLVR